MNVAYHLQKFGVESHMISRVGNDEAGKKLLNLLNDWNIPTTNCQIDEAHETGKVEAIAGANEEMTYVIHESAAWDYIATEPAYDELVADADVFVSDFRLPGATGVEFLAAIRQRSTKPFKAVILTGDTSRERVAESERSGWPVLFKPIKLSALLAAIAG